MSVFHHGFKGLVTVPTGLLVASTIYINAYTYTWEHELEDYTLFESGTAQTNYRVMGYGMAKLTGEFSGFLDATVTVDLLSAATIDKTATAGFVLQQQAASGTPGTLTFDAVMGTIRVGMQRTGPSTVTATFESSGPITSVNAS